MTIINLIGHPVVVVVFYLLLIIEDEQFGGIFFLYVLLALPHAVRYALIASIGIAAVVFAFNIHSDKRQVQKAFLYVFGFGLMILSLVIFFSKGNKWQTFQLGIPTASFVLFGICSICFLIRTLSEFATYLQSKQRLN